MTGTPIVRVLAALMSMVLVTAVGRRPPVLAQAPDIAGRWAGALEILGRTLEFSVTFARADGVLVAKMDIPAQGAHGLDLVNVTADETRAHFELDAGPGLAVWDGARSGDGIEGVFTQGGGRGSFRVERADGETVEAVTEEPDEPLPYAQEDFAFDNGSVHLVGTLTLPEGDGPFPAVVMVTGSGPQNRDEELLGFRPFRIIADHLTRNAIAVLRYDDRGVRASSGDIASSTTSDFADDALAAIARLGRHPAIDAERIGIIGHSEGGVVAPMAAQRSSSVAFVVLLAGTSVPGAEVIYEQLAEIARAAGQSEDEIAEALALQRRIFGALAAGDDLEGFREELEAIGHQQAARLTAEQRALMEDEDLLIKNQVSGQLAQLRTPWFRFFLSYDPAAALRETTVPVLALFGALDLQVTPAQNRGPMAEALGHNPDVTIETFPRANHLFQRAGTGSPDEYATLEKVFVPGLLEMLSGWIDARFGGV